MSIWMMLAPATTGRAGEEKDSLPPRTEEKINNSPELIRLKYFLSHPNPKRLPFARKDAAALEKMGARYPTLRNRAAGELKEAFEARWINGTGNGNLNLETFEALENQLPCFGSGRGGLVSMLGGKKIPAGWNDGNFVQWVREKLPSQVDGQDTAALMLKEIPAGGTNAVKRYVFLHKILPQTAHKTLEGRFNGLWDHLSDKELASAHKEVSRLFPRAQQNGMSSNLRRKLGNRLYELPVLDWPNTAGEMESLIEAADPPAADFLRKASDFCRSNENGGRSDKAAQLLLRLTKSVPSATSAFLELNPDADAEWFDFLNRKNILPSVCGTNRGLRTGAFRILLVFLGQGEMRRLFPHVRKIYYPWFPDRSFMEILRPRAREGDNRDLVLEAALQNDFSPDHRAKLARDCLSGGKPFDPAWKGAKPRRLDIAINLYRKLLIPTPKVSRNALRAHIDRLLLGDILLACTGLIKDKTVQKEEAFRRLKNIGKHLSQCQRAGADFKGNQPLRRMAGAVETDINDHLTELGRRPRESMALDQATREDLRVFVAKLSVYFELHDVFEAVLEKSRQDWTSPIRRTLRSAVFGLPKNDSSACIYWPENLTRFRAALLLELDAPLRECLITKPQVYAKFFKDIYLPLAKVHGFIKVLGEEKGRKPGDLYLAWIEQAPKSSGDLMKKLFSALNTDRFLDCEPAMMAFAKKGLALQSGLGSVWMADPDRFFCGQWGVNANLRVYRKLLHEAGKPPDGADLRKICKKIVSLLEAGPVAKGIVFPFENEIPPRDEFEDPWKYADWSMNMVQASEWKYNRFEEENGETLPTGDRLKWQGKPEQPFSFELKGGEKSRKVSGDLRFRLAKTLVEHLPEGEPDRRKSLLKVAEFVSFLPNNRDNFKKLKEALYGLQDFQKMRQQIYGRVNTSLSQLNSHERDLLETAIRRMMWLEVSTRRASGLVPPFNDVMGRARRASDDEALGMALDSIMLERSKLRDSLKGKKPDNLLEVKRRSVDLGIRHLFPETYRQATVADRADLMNQTYKKRLKSLNDRRVRELLEFKDNMADILKESSPNLDDFGRATSLMGLVEYTLWTGRSDFDPESYVGVSLQAKEGAWWPALSVLAAFDGNYRKEMRRWCRELKGKEHEELVKKAIRTVFFQNEAVYWTVVAAAKKKNRKEILNFSHDISVHEKNFIILADAYREIKASAGSLATDALSGAADNLEWLRDRSDPSDLLISEFLHGNVHKNYLNGADLHLARPVTKLTYSYQALVNHAGGWKGAEFPENLQTAASGFLIRGCPPDSGLISGAKTAEGAMKALAWVVKEKPAPGQHARVFYHNSLVDKEGGLQKHVYDAVATPFFTNSFEGQKGTWENLLAGWRNLYRGIRKDPALKKDKLAKAFKGGFSQIASDLFKGTGRPKECDDYLWRPVDELEKEEGIREKPPEEFLKLCKWFFSLENKSDPPEIKGLFSLDSPSEPANEK